MKRRLKLLISLGVHLFDLCCRALRLQRAPRCVILYYHAVPAQHRELFARQMELLLRLARPLPAGAPAKLEPGHHYVAVTFDDGFVSVLHNAAPELRCRQIPWTMFVPSGCLGQSPAWLRRASAVARQDRVMTRAELRELASDPLVTIGSHTLTHAHLVEVGPERARAELADSKFELERIIGRPVDQFSYPFGARNSTLDETARALGYRRLYSTAPVVVRSPQEFVCGRMSVDPDISPLEFRLKLLGAYRWLAVRNR